jgi:MFS-type transporter involved in bile tolerance (Atg22 family)
VRLGWREVLAASAAVAAVSLALLLWGAPPVTALALTFVVPVYVLVGVLHGLDRTMAWAPTVALVFALSGLTYIAVAAVAGEAIAEPSLYGMYYRAVLTAALCSSAYLAAYALASRADARFEAVELGEAFERAAEPLKQLFTKEEGPRLERREPLL